MCLKIVGQGELHRVGGHHRQPHARSELNCGDHMCLVISATGALQFQIEAMRKDAAQPQRCVCRTNLISQHQGLSDRARLGTRKRYQSFAEFSQPFEFDRRLRLVGIARPCTCQQF